MVRWGTLVFVGAPMVREDGLRRECALLVRDSRHVGGWCGTALVDVACGGSRTPRPVDHGPSRYGVDPFWMGRCGGAR